MISVSGIEAQYFRAMINNDITSLLKRYDVAVPRYTSYPTVPHWNYEGFRLEQWKEAVTTRFDEQNGELCIYVHLPFCEELCTYCACNKRITKNHKVEEPYLSAVLKEWEMYKSLFSKKPIIREIHLGGGSPTFFSPFHLNALISGLTHGADLAPQYEFSVEVHPNHTTSKHLEALYACGFNRISVGVQDFDPSVQFLINRLQTFERTKEVIDQARVIGFTSVNIDLIYGLPGQSVFSIEHTIDRVQELNPDRIAYYSYAHVPWKSKGQRRYTEEDLPQATKKIEMYLRGSERLHALGFESIGMDHFAKPSDKLMIAYSSGALHRNFMGYTTTNHRLVIGLGASSISDAWSAFAQNEKTVEEYQLKVLQGNLPIVNGHVLSETDLIIRRSILDLMCKEVTAIPFYSMSEDHQKEAYEKLLQFATEGLIELEGHEVRVTERGRLFIRNIASTLDVYLHSQLGESQFSKAI